ncbi:hypothetical protein XarbCFBP7614_09735 [Xanthomonas arboricola]|nr:hypothetical protein XarbCFBP7614_09735 [Xanthomonas arboricola]
MPRKSLQGRTCGVSGDGGRARTRRDGRCAWLRAEHDALVGLLCGLHQHPRHHLTASQPARSCEPFSSF